MRNLSRLNFKVCECRNFKFLGVQILGVHYTLFSAMFETTNI